MRFLVALLAFVLFAGCVTSTPAPPPSQRPKKLVLVNAADLVAYYQSNEVKADLDYKGKTFAVQGRIESVGKDIMDTPYICLAGPNGSMFGVQCMFTDTDQALLAELQRGQSVAIAGKCSGKLMSVQMDGCWIWSQ